MKIEYKVSGAAGGYSVLMDSTAGDTIEPWEPSYSADAQVDPLAFNTAASGSKSIKPQGNIVCQLPLHAMNVNYGSAAAALAASRTVPVAFLNNKLNLKVTEGAEVQYFPNAVCTSCKPNVQGSCVTYNMDLTTQMVTATEPA